MRDSPFDPADKALLDQAVRGLQDDLPDDARMRRLERLVAPSLVADADRGRWWRRSHLRILGGAIIVMALGGAYVGMHRSSGAPSLMRSDVPTDPGEPSSPVRAPDVPAVIETPSSATPIVSVDSLPTAAPDTAKPSIEAKAKRAPDAPRADREQPSVPAEDPGDELALLEDARRSLGSDPTRTLALAETHTKRFRTPALAQERERLAIDALVRLGRRADAEARAKAFEATYPDSAHLARVRALVAPRVAP